MTGPGLTYRSDIDGLRAVAVASVVLFHAGAAGFGGGFVGVDVFFVISGYLITSIIMDEIAAGQFSTSQFYERRIRRIFPALFAMMAASSAAAVILFFPRDFREFGDSVTAATLFVSNIFFWRTSDYFAGPAHLTPLLHTWSLSVEEQFYIVFPPLLLVIQRWGRGAFRTWLLALLAVSFAISVWSVAEKPVAAFYLAPSRAWELLLGALVALGAMPGGANTIVREGLGALGLVLIGWAVTTYSIETAFPGVNALAPCLGAALLIYSGQGPSTSASRLLSLKPVVFTGLISYSLYLWHWPLLVFARHWNGEALSTAQTSVIVLVSVGIAIASWKYIEQPFRSGAFRIGGQMLFRAAAAIMAGAVVFGSCTKMTDGWPGRFRDYHRPRIAGLEVLKEGRCFLGGEQGPWNYAGLEPCRTGGSDDQKVLVWGDSFAAHLVPGLSALADASTSVVEYAASGCPPVLGLDVANRPHCRAFNQHALRVIEEMEPDSVILAARWELYMPRTVQIERIQDTVDVLNQLGVSVILVGQSPSFDFDHPYDYIYRKGVTAARVNFSPWLNISLASVRDAAFFDPMPLFCTGTKCALRDGPDFLFFDGGHFSTVGSKRVGAALLPFVAKTILAASGGVAVSESNSAAADPGAAAPN